jgi:hypothetical protein
VQTFLDQKAQDAVFKKCEVKMNKMCNPICDQRDIPKERNKTQEGKNDNHNSVLALVGNYDTSQVQINAVVLIERDRYKEEEVLKKTAIFKFFTHRPTENNAVNKIILDEETEFKRLVDD